MGYLSAAGPHRQRRDYTTKTSERTYEARSMAICARMIYFCIVERMKELPRTSRPAALIGIVLMLALLGAVASPGENSSPGYGGAARVLQTTLTPPAQEVSEIGSTDGIVLMGILIVLIIVIPVILQRKTSPRS